MTGTGIGMPGAAEASRATRVAVANNLNTLQSQINRLMLDNASAVNYTPKKLEETAIFKSLVASEARSMVLPLSQLVDKGYLSRQEVQRLARLKITTLGDLFSNPLVRPEFVNVQDLRMAVITRLLGVSRK
jgi:hypothetical protein